MGKGFYRYGDNFFVKALFFVIKMCYDNNDLYMKGVLLWDYREMIHGLLLW